MSELDAQLEEVARSPVLLVASDYDGTIAPIVDDPTRAEANRESLVAIRALSQMPQTHVAIISGRALADLASRARETDEVHLVGSHGSEFEAGFVAPLPPEARNLVQSLIGALRPVEQETPGAMIELKPASLAFHYRNVDTALKSSLVEQILRGPGAWPGVHVRHGKEVIELSVVSTDKGAALGRLRRRLGATAVLFLGDDVTDEDAFATLSGPDLGIKVGPGTSIARFRVPHTLDVARLLARVAEQRADWLAGSHAVPITDHSLLSDQRTIALVDPRGRIVWMCLPRIDSSAVFAELLGGSTAGFFEIRTTDPTRVSTQEYVADTLTLRTIWPGFTVTDYLDCSSGRAYQRAGRTDLLRVIEGRGHARVAFAPRLDFGRIETRLRIANTGLVVEGAVDPLVLYAPGIKWEIRDEGRHQTATAIVELKGDPVVLELRYGTGNLGPDSLPEPVRRDKTNLSWSRWASTLTSSAVGPDIVRRSALVLRALTFGPTGAIAAAATTSLPEHAGGVRNWDYRYCWPRDAAMAAAALVRLGAPGPAVKFLDWVLGILDRSAPGSLLCPVYTVTGGDLGPEGEIGQLAGYSGSRPVRVGNAAARQIQLDVFGPIAELMALLSERGAALSSEHWRMLESMVSAIGSRWAEPDHGIWEVRRARQQHVHSKVMCWQTVDRALAVANYLGKQRPDWDDLRRQISSDILEHGFRPHCQAFCATYDDGEPDASALCVGLSGLLAPDDPRFLGTIRHVELSLLDGPTVRRYLFDDGLPGSEGGFHLCTGWLVEAYTLSGQHQAAQRLFQRWSQLCGPTGQMSEEYCPRTHTPLGNHPQAYSHLALINAALRLTKEGQSPISRNR